jgi:DNA processing protein
MWENELIRSLTTFPSERFSTDRIPEVLEWCKQTDTHLWKPPANSPLFHLPRPPEILFVRGDIQLLEESAISIVGTRRPSPHGLATSARFASELASSGLVVVSGLAAGIDSAAHRGAIAVQGKTLAVLGSGLDMVYPRFNRPLFELILKEGGCLVSEYPPGTPPRRHHFPIRNRIIAALGRATLVIEAALGSGSLITAVCAADLGRDVYVVPGKCDDKNYEGGHKLIQDGASLLFDVEEIIERYGGAGKSGIINSYDDELARFFHQPMMTLDELFSVTHWTLSELVERLQSAKASGLVIEFGYQRYAIVDSKIKRSLPNEK